MKELYYRFVIFIVAVLNVVIDNYLIIILILLVCAGVHMAWRVRRWNTSKPQSRL